MSEFKPIISFPDQSKSFAYGVEFGRILQKMQEGRHVIENDGLPVRYENMQVLQSAAKHYGYVCCFSGDVWQGEWVQFKAVKGAN